jgi:hypothetical protein
MTSGFILLAIAVVAFTWIARSFRNEEPPPPLIVDREAAIAAD